MAETVVHVTTLEQWKSVLDVWFKQGYRWLYNSHDYYYDFFEAREARYLMFDDEEITCFSGKFRDSPAPVIEYSEFMAQQKEDNKMATVYEVSQSVFDELQRIKAHEGTSLIGAITLNAKLIKSIKVGNKAILRYLADDPAIEFKVKEQLYRLWRIDSDGERVYMKFGISGTPTYTPHENSAFTAPLEEIKKWQTPAWEIEKAD